MKSRERALVGLCEQLLKIIETDRTLIGKLSGLVEGQAQLLSRLADAFPAESPDLADVNIQVAACLERAEALRCETEGLFIKGAQLSDQTDLLLAAFNRPTRWRRVWRILSGDLSRD